MFLGCVMVSVPRWCNLSRVMVCVLLLCGVVCVPRFVFLSGLV